MQKDCSKFLKQCMEYYLNKQINQLYDNLLQNQEMIGIKVSLDKKAEKNFVTNLKNMLRTGIIKDKYDIQMQFIRLISYYLIDKFNIFLPGNSDDVPFLIQYCKLAIKLTADKDL